MHYDLSLSLPRWTESIVLPKSIATDNEKMTFVINLALRNIDERTGGPFGAAIFAGDELISIGVNTVIPNSSSLAHAEMMAFGLAQKHYDSFSLSAEGLPSHTLVTSAEMCCMCMGASIWSGVRRIVYGATGSDVEELAGFDEGPKPNDWINALALRDIEVIPGVLRSEACQVLKKYKTLNGVIYGGGVGKAG